MNELSEFLHDVEANEIIDAKAKIKGRVKQKKNSVQFPIDCFPDFCCKMARAYCECYGSSMEHYGLAMLTVAGAAIGNSAWVVERGNEHPPIFYAVIVDQPGRGKTPIIKTLIRPLVKLEKKFREEYEKQVFELGDQAPPAKEILLNDFTLESVYKVLSANPRGALVFRDEVTGWLGSMNQYKSKGSDEQFWLENYNSGFVKISRQKDQNPIFVSNSFVSVIGTSQPVMLSKFCEGEKGLNGFLARMLFSYPIESKKLYYSTKKPDRVFVEKWESLISKLVNIPTVWVEGKEGKEIAPTLLELDNAAWQLYRDYYNENTDLVNRSDDEIEQAVITKFDGHVLRVALVLRLLRWSELEATDYPISAEDFGKIKIDGVAMQNAIRVANYFRSTSLRVVGRMAGPVEQMPENYRIWYESLPEEIESKHAISLALDAQISQRTAARLLNRQDLFKRLRKGVYIKNFI